MPYVRHSSFHQWSSATATPYPRQRRSFSPARESSHHTRHLIDSASNPYVTSIERDLFNLGTWADDLSRLRRQCDELYEQARAAQMRGEYERAQRRLVKLRAILEALDGEMKGYGLRGSLTRAKVYLE